ncbi:MAG: hypothetical protein V6Z78_03985 [Holosporaceae bacterium]
MLLYWSVLPFYIIFYSFALANVCFLPAVSSGIEEEKSVVPSVPFGSHNIEGSFKDGIHEGFLSELNEDEKKSCIKRLRIFDMSCETAVGKQLSHQPSQSLWCLDFVMWAKKAYKNIAKQPIHDDNIEYRKVVFSVKRLTMTEYVVFRKDYYHSSLMIEGTETRVTCSFSDDKQGIRKTLTYVPAKRLLSPPPAIFPRSTVLRARVLS